MNFDLTEEQETLKGKARDLMEKEIIPIASKYDRHVLSKAQIHEIFGKLIPVGYIDGPIPKKYGGRGLDFVSYGILIEELARAWTSLVGAVADNIYGALYLVANGSEEQKKKFLPSLLSGEKLHAFACTEPNAGSDLGGLETTAVLDGKYYLINGTKRWISNGSVADFASVLALTDKSKGTKGVSTLFVEKKISEFHAKELPKTMVRSLPTAELSFKNCRVPRENLLGEPGSGYKQMLTGLAFMRTIMATAALGLSQASIDSSVKYAKERHQFGKPIGSFQLIQEMIADMIIETEASRLLTYRAFWLFDKGRKCLQASSIAKTYSTEAAVRATSKAVRIHGAWGVSEAYPVERYFRDAEFTTVGEATNEIHRLLIGREALGLAAFV